MKRYIWLMLWAVCFQIQAQDDAIEKFYSKYMEDDRFSRVYISPKMMQMAGGFLKSATEDSDQDAQKLGELVSKIRGIRILNGEKVRGNQMFEEAIQTLNKNRYEELMDIKDKSQSLKFMVREENGKIRELLMVSGTENDFTLLSMTGTFTYEDLHLLSEKTNLPGMNEYRSNKTN
ncbi:DUF4252 domain-containing protein [Negadavirga shengliensis]|uniref:DUF4252 domain-containing protein n=1 Tax=Negadavirga shengliensis TaxID=1389218 RepID=A0ABV9T1J0_9BACT